MFELVQASHWRRASVVGRVPLPGMIRSNSVSIGAQGVEEE